MLIMTSSYPKYLLAVCVSLISLIIGCSDSLSGPSDTLKPTVVVYSPVSNDTIATGKYEIISEMSDDQGIKFVDVYINDVMQARYSTPENQYRPVAYLNLDSGYVNKRISYYINVYDVSNNFTKSEVKSNILVLENIDPPISPYSIDVRLISANLINVFWEDTNRFEKGFEVWRKEGLSGTYTLWKTVGMNTFNTNDASINPSQTYFYKVRAFNDFGKSPFTYEVTSVGSGGSPNLPPPSNLTAQARATNIIYLTWQDNSNNETFFQVERKTGNTGFIVAGRVPPNRTSFQDSANGLASSTEYKYRIKVYSETDSSWSQEVTVATYALVINTPSNLIATQFDSVTVKLTWSDNSMYETRTFIERKIGDGGTYIQLGEVGTDATVFEDRTYSPNVKNVYRVRATDGNGSFSNYSSEASIIPTRVGGLATPTNFTGVQSDVNKVLLNWTDNSTTETFTVIEWRTGGNAYSEIKYVAANLTTYTHDGFEFDQQNFYRARSFDGVSFSSYSNEVIVTPSSTYGIAAPSDLTLTQLTNPSRISLNWVDNSTHETQNIVEWRTESSQFIVIATLGVNVTSYTHTTPTPNVVNYYRVRVTNGKGFSSYSNVPFITPLP